MFKNRGKKYIKSDNTKLITYLNNIIGCDEGKSMSRIELANKLGVTKSTIDKWLDGRVPLNDEYTDKICEVLNLDKNMFVGESSKEYDFLLKYSTLNIASKKKILEYIDFLFAQEQVNQKGKNKTIGDMTWKK